MNMKLIKRGATVLRVTGIVLILVAVVLGLYALANVSGPWNQLSGAMKNAGADTGLTDRLAFDDPYFTALSKAAGTRAQDQEARRSAIEGGFARYFDRAENAEGAAREKAWEEACAWFENEFDASAYLERYSTLENLMETQELRDIFEFVNSLSAPSGKKAARLKAASLEPWFQEYYASFKAEHGEEATGSWYEFMSALYSLINEAREGGTAIKDVKAFVQDIGLEAYSERLALVREESRESSGNFAQALAQACQDKAEGKASDFRALLSGTYEAVLAKYPDKSLGGRDVFAVAASELVREEGFDGSYNQLAERMEDLNEASAASSFASFKTSFLDRINTEADNRASVGIISAFWAIAAKYLVILAVGIVLVLLGKGIGWAVGRHLLAQRKNAGIQEDPEVLLRVSHLKQYFRSGDYINKAVDDVSFVVKRGEVFGLVGESGCGKTTTGRTIINLYDPTEGDVYFDGLRISSNQNGLPVLKAQLRAEYRAALRKLKEAPPENAAKLKADLKAGLRRRLGQAEDSALESSVEKDKCVQLYREKRLRELKEAYDEDMETLSGAEAEARTRRYETERAVAAKDNIMTRMQMIFQDPIASINPRMTVREIIAEGLVIRGIKDKAYIDEKVYEMLELVGLVREHADRYPHEFSGGQRQRIGIARAIVMEPDLIIADEPISALDVSIQAQVINLLNELRDRMGLTIIFIAHNLSVVKYFSDRIAVMYYGKIVEMTTSDELFEHPLHPYTKSLLSAIPYPDPHYEKARKRVEYNPAKAHDYSVDKPALKEIVPGHWVQCNAAEEAVYLRELGKA